MDVIGPCALVKKDADAYGCPAGGRRRLIPPDAILPVLSAPYRKTDLSKAARMFERGPDLSGGCVIEGRHLRRQFFY